MAKRYLSMLCLLMATSAGVAQDQSLSPYSIYGLGDDAFNGTAAHAGMAGTKLALNRPDIINMYNPATFAHVRRPVFDLGVASHFLVLQGPEGTQSGNDTYIKNIQFAFPIINKAGNARRLGLSLGLAPFTRMGYTVSTTDSFPDVGEVEYLFQGNGGLNKLYLGLGYDLISDSGMVNQLSIGATGNFVFGHLNKVSYTIFNPGAKFYNTQGISSVTVNDVMFTGGIFYQHRWYRIKDDEVKTTAFSIGATFTPQTNLKSFAKQDAYTYRGDSAARVYYDTIISSSQEGHVAMPFEVGVGAGLSLGNKWAFLADYTYNPYSELTIHGVGQSLSNVQTVSIGAELIPDFMAYKRFFQVLRYRGGLRYSQSRLSIRGNQMAEYGINVGLGIPLTASSSGSMINIGFEYGQRQHPSVPTSEGFYRLSFGLTLTPHQYDRWFHKRKYD